MRRGFFIAAVVGRLTNNSLRAKPKQDVPIYL
jgi:hypothetical protein